MRKIFLPLIVLALITGAESSAQKKKPIAASGLIGNAGKDAEKNAVAKNLKITAAEKVMEIQIPEGGGNGASVAYNPEKKLYYAAQAGSIEFPLVIFTSNSKVVSDENQKTLIDVRGLWFNPKSKQLEGNAYNDFGWFSYELDKNGLPEKLNRKKEGLNQPDQNSAGALNTDQDEVLFLAGLKIACYSTEAVDKRKSVQLHIGAIRANEYVGFSTSDFEETYNTNSIIYTGIKGAEIGLLNIAKKEVELYNLKSGYLSQVIQLPVQFELETQFNFAFANGIFWLFDKQSRKWNGYK